MELAPSISPLVLWLPLFFLPSFSKSQVHINTSTTKKVYPYERQHILAVSICCGISLLSGHTSESSFARKQPNSIAVAAYRPLQRATKVLGLTTQCLSHPHCIFSCKIYVTGGPPRLLVV
ncbi:hypothetical protein J3F84DRAFT_373617 [Trichoderma pleuroticola]